MSHQNNTELWEGQQSFEQLQNLQCSVCEDFEFFPHSTNVNLRFAEAFLVCMRVGRLEGWAASDAESDPVNVKTAVDGTRGAHKWPVVKLLCSCSPIVFLWGEQCCAAGCNSTPQCFRALRSQLKFWLQSCMELTFLKYNQPTRCVWRNQEQHTQTGVISRAGEKNSACLKVLPTLQH